MPRPQEMRPHIGQRDNGVWYAMWYDPVARRTRRQSLKTRDRALALQHFDQVRVEGAVLKEAEARRQIDWRPTATTLYRKARNNASAKGRVVLISMADVLDLIKAQHGLCAVTGMPLDPNRSRRNPWMASLDRIDNSRGYLPSNIRVVCLMANVAMNVWGEDALVQLVNGLARNRSLRANVCDTYSALSVDPTISDMLG